MFLDTTFSQEPDALKRGQHRLSKKLRSGANSNATPLTDCAFLLPPAVLCSFNQNLL